MEVGEEGGYPRYTVPTRMIPALVSVTAGQSSEFQRDTKQDAFQLKVIYDSTGMKPRTFKFLISLATDRQTQSRRAVGRVRDRWGWGGGVIGRKGREANDLLTY